MANLIYRESSSAPIPSSDSVKSAPLTYLEADGNLRSLKVDLDTKAKLTDPTQVITAQEFIGGGSQLTGVVATQTDAVKTQSNNTNAPYFLTFVQNNNGSGGYESVGTDEGIYFNPGTNLLTILGNVSATDFNSTSDKRLKNNIKELREGCSTVALLNPVSFEYKENNKLSYGLVAQELEKVLPELVSEREDGFKAVSYIPLISILITAVKELDARVQELESRV